MKRFALTCMLKDDPQILEKYDAHHADPWPQVTRGGYDAGIRRVFIYRIKCRLFMFMETVDDFDSNRDLYKYRSDPKCAQWDDLMRTFQTHVPEAEPGTTWVQMQEIHAVENGQVLAGAGG